MWDGGSRPREPLPCLLERGDRLLWFKQRIRGGCIRPIQHSVLTTDGAGGESPAPLSFAGCLELDFAAAGFVLGYPRPHRGEKHAGRPYTVQRCGLKMLACDYRIEQSFSMGLPMTIPSPRHTTVIEINFAGRGYCYRFSPLANATKPAASQCKDPSQGREPESQPQAF